MEFKEGINLILGLIGGLSIIISFININERYKLYTLIGGSIAIILFIVTIQLSTKFSGIEKKLVIQDNEIKKLNEKIKIYEDIANLKIRIQNLEEKKR